MASDSGNYFEKYLKRYENRFSNAEMEDINQRIEADFNALTEAKRNIAKLWLTVKSYLQRKRINITDVFAAETGNTDDSEKDELKELSEKCDKLVAELKDTSNELFAVRRANKRSIQMHTSSKNKMKMRISDLKSQNNVDVDALEKHFREGLRLIGRTGDKATKINCTMCDATFTTTYSMDRHVREQHEGYHRDNSVLSKRNRRK